jgi:hypothetical protein
MTETRHCDPGGTCNSAACSAMQFLANQTGEYLKAAVDLQLGYNEETITETALLTFKQRHQKSSIILPFTKHAEARNGADWEWLIGNDRTGWRCYRIQAKRLHIGNYFRGLLTQEAGSSGKTQIDMLIERARDDSNRPGEPRRIPAYCFYIRSPELTSSIWDGPPKLEGCVIAGAETIQSINSNQLDEIKKIAFPWHLLSCSCLPATGALPDWLSLLATGQPGPPSDIVEAIIASALAERFKPSQRVPSYMARAHAMLRDGDMIGGHQTSELASFVFRESQAQERGLAGVMLLDTSFSKEFLDPRSDEGAAP